MAKFRAIFLDWYNTVARFDPPRENLQVEACAALGISIEKTAIRQAYPAADDFLTQENGDRPLSQRTSDEVADFWARYEQLLLAQAGVDVDNATAGNIFRLLRERQRGLVTFDDVPATLAILRGQGYLLGLLSNMNDDLDKMARESGIDTYIDFTVTSREVGAAKPHPPIFREALRRAGAAPHEAVHVGDQYQSDVVGAMGVGIQPVLIDRDGVTDGSQQYPTIRSLSELPDLVKSFEDEAH